MIPFLPYAIIGTAVAIAVELFKSDEKDADTEKPEDSKTPDETRLPNYYQRGDRFFCPDTGIELQIRAVGGRPRKEKYPS